VQSTGTVNRRERLHPEQLLNYQIPLPPLDEQRRIVDLLERATGIRRLREQALAKARAIVPALFLDMFGDLASNPEAWPSRALGSLIAGLQGGRNLQSGDEGVSPFRILRISAVTGGTFRPEESKPAPLGYAPPPEHFVRVGDLLITRANTVDLVGAVAQVYTTPTNLLLPDKIWRFLWLKKSSVTPSYIEAAFCSGAIRTELRKLATGTSDSMRNISQAKLLRLMIQVPPLPLQQEFADRLADLRSIIAQQERSLAAARELERSLMARLLG
jgi:type I restriction enzyme S subunit